MEDVKQEIWGCNNVQVAGDYIITGKIVRKTEVIHNADFHITDAQAKEIRDIVQKIAEPRKSYQNAYGALYNKYKITSYKLLPKDKYEDAIKWLKKRSCNLSPETSED
jgi:hypothetical protein